MNYQLLDQSWRLMWRLVDLVIEAQRNDDPARVARLRRISDRAGERWRRRTERWRRIVV